MSRTITLIVNKEELKIDLDDELQIFNVSDDQTKIASQMAFWGEVWGQAKAESIKIDAMYRQWRAKVGKAISDDSKKKVSEWKIRQIIESDPKFKQLKMAIGDAERNVIVSHAIFESFKSKAAVLSSKGAMERAVFERTGMVTKGKKKNRIRDKEQESKKKKMKKIFKKNKEK